MTKTEDHIIDGIEALGHMMLGETLEDNAYHYTYKFVNRELYQ